MDTPTETQVTRRQLLGATAAATVGSMSGCVQRFRSIVNRQSPETVSLTVTAPPADSDRLATLIARHLVSNLEEAGIDATLDVLPESELYRQVFLNRDFELFVARMPQLGDPHEYKSLVYSPFAGEPGWQNPYRFTNPTVDDSLRQQQTTSGTERDEAVADLIRQVSRYHPFTVIGFPDEIRAVRSENFTGWQDHGLRDPLAYLALERATDTDEELSLELATTDSRLTRNLNPLAIEYRQAEPFTTLLYDPLARRIDGEIIPWLATDWEFDENADSMELTATLRPGQVWHDGTSITADDVAFTYRFLADTSLDSLEQTVPAPRFRAQTSLVSECRAVDDRTVEITFENASTEVAKQALTVPILPEREWREKTDVADISGLEGSENVTEAIVESNTSAVGSGPLEVDSTSSDEEAVFVPFENHFLRRGEDDQIPDRFLGDIAFDELAFEVVPSNETAVELVVQGELDATATGVDPREPVIQRIGEAQDTSMLVEHSPVPYQIGYNTSARPFSNPYFCRLVAQLVDKEYVTDTILEGYGTPASNPFDGTKWTPNELAFDGEDPVVPFIGTDGDVDVEKAREAFRERGYEFDEDGTLILR